MAVIPEEPSPSLDGRHPEEVESFAREGLPTKDLCTCSNQTDEAAWFKANPPSPCSADTPVRAPCGQHCSLRETRPDWSGIRQSHPSSRGAP